MTWSCWTEDGLSPAGPTSLSQPVVRRNRGTCWLEPRAALRLNCHDPLPGTSTFSRGVCLARRLHPCLCSHRSCARSVLSGNAAQPSNQPGDRRSSPSPIWCRSVSSGSVLALVEISLSRRAWILPRLQQPSLAALATANWQHVDVDGSCSCLFVADRDSPRSLDGIPGGAMGRPGVKRRNHPAVGHARRSYSVRLVGSGASHRLASHWRDASTGVRQRSFWKDKRLGDSPPSTSMRPDCCDASTLGAPCSVRHSRGSPLTVYRGSPWSRRSSFKALVWPCSACGRKSLDFVVRSICRTPAEWILVN